MASLSPQNCEALHTCTHAVRGSLKSHVKDPFPLNWSVFCQTGTSLLGRNVCYVNVSNASITQALLIAFGVQ